MGWFNKVDDDGNFAPDAIHVAGLPEYKYKDLVHMIVDETNKQITFTGNNRFNRGYRPDVILSFDKLIGAEFVTETQLKDASVIGGAVIGNVLFGGTGAIVGALNAQGKKKSKNVRYFAISYRSGNEKKTILFKDGFGYAKKLKNILNEAGRPEEPDSKIQGSIEL